MLGANLEVLWSMKKEHLTNERLRKKFKNNFDLCNFSINIARNIILSGTQADLSEILDSVEERADESNS
jgi:hypothetical protein